MSTPENKTEEIVTTENEVTGPADAVKESRMTVNMISSCFMHTPNSVVFWSMSLDLQSFLWESFLIQQEG